jgi:hypothetical protein
MRLIIEQICFPTHETSYEEPSASGTERLKLKLKALEIGQIFEGFSVAVNCRSKQSRSPIFNLRIVYLIRYFLFILCTPRHIFRIFRLLPKHWLLKF